VSSITGEELKNGGWQRFLANSPNWTTFISLTQ